MADGARSVLGHQNQSVDVVDDIEFRRGRYRWPESKVEQFLWRCQLRQDRRKAPFARSYWVIRRGWDRREYDALLKCLEDNGYIVDRRPGASGKLPARPDQLLSDTRYRLGVN